MAKTPHIYYLVGFDTETKKWYSADNLLHVLTESGSVLDVDPDSDETPEWRYFEGTEEVEADFENLEDLSQFLRKANDNPRLWQKTTDPTGMSTTQVQLLLFPPEEIASEHNTVLQLLKTTKLFLLATTELQLVTSVRVEIRGSARETQTPTLNMVREIMTSAGQLMLKQMQLLELHGLTCKTQLSM